jgi:hypothetical protein
MSVYEGPANWWAVNNNSGRTHISTKAVSQSGLIMNLDAGSSTSYSGSGTTWTDLTGTNNGTLVNGPYYSSFSYGSMGFDGTNDYMTSTLATTSGQAVTYEGWLYSIETTSTARNFVDSGSANPRIWWNTSGQIEFDSTGFTTTTVYRNQWVHVVLSKPSGSSAASYYVNGVLVGTGSAYTTPAVTPAWFNVAAASTWKGKCAMIHVYNRALSAAEILSNYNATSKRFTAVADFSFISSGGVATGGDITDVEGYRYHIFNSSNNLTVSSGSGNVEYAIVAGGGGGGVSGGWEAGGGGGAGGMLTGTISINTASSPYTITVGAGGAARTTGSNSSAFSLTANGGGKGGVGIDSVYAGGPGGSGGGATTGSGGLGTTGQGSNGGSGIATGTQCNIGGPGGGGKSAVGLSSKDSVRVGAPGGAGQLFGFSYYAGGGSGGNGNSNVAQIAALGGGGVGQTNAASAIAGTINTGGGGGGGRYAAAGTTAAAGGSGVVIIRYPL